MTQVLLEPMSNKAKEKLESVDVKIKHFWLYILKLEEDKYYIGITSLSNPNKRIDQHRVGYFSAQWTKKYKPVKTIDIRDLGYVSLTEAKLVEDKLTMEYMKNYGLQNVRGGDYTYSGKYVKIGSTFWPDYIFDSIVGLLFVLIILILLIIKTL
jgi:predicted GIY-YIG superfamily endonuclease